MILRKYLIVRADGEVRVVSKTPRLSLDEFAYRLIVKIPESWASIVGQIDIELPEPTVPPEVTVDEL